MRSLEKFVFDMSDNVLLHNVKRELFAQIIQFDINMNAKGFFTVNDKFVASVSALQRQNKMDCSYQLRTKGAAKE